MSKLFFSILHLLETNRKGVDYLLFFCKQVVFMKRPKIIGFSQKKYFQHGERLEIETGSISRSVTLCHLYGMAGGEWGWLHASHEPVSVFDLNQVP